MLIYIILFTVLIGLIGVGGAYLFLRLFAKAASRLLLVVSFAAGALLGVSFLELLPEAQEAGGSLDNILLFVLLGFVFFYLLARFLVWHHCHDEHCLAHTSASLIIIGDTAHNFLDGLAIAAAFTVNFSLGLMTSLAIIFHEIPQEIGDFGVLLHSGYSKLRALTVNIFSALVAVLGGIAGFYFLEAFQNFLPYLLAITAGNFIYLGASDLLPQTHQPGRRSAVFYHASAFVLGILILWLLGLFIHE